MDKVLEPIKVSIIVAVYNAEKDLPKCLDSLIAQTYSNIEIICIDDCSSDGSLSVLKDYANRDKRLSVIHHEVNTNAGAAYNDGIKAATGEYICVVDNDDWLSPNAIEVLVRESDNGKYDIVGAARNSMYGTRIDAVNNTFLISIDKNKIITHALLNGFGILGDLIRRDIFIKNDFFYPSIFYEEIAIGYCMLFLADSIKGIADPLYNYSHVPTSVTAKPSIRKINERIQATDLCVENLKQRGFYDTEYKELINYKYLIYSAYTMIMICKLSWKEAKPLRKLMQSKIKTYLPNNYLKQTSYKNRMIIKHPKLFYVLGYLYVRINKGRR